MTEHVSLKNFYYSKLLFILFRIKMLLLAALSFFYLLSSILTVNAVIDEPTVALQSSRQPLVQLLC